MSSSYSPTTHTFTERESSFTGKPQRCPLSTLGSFFPRRDVIVVASVSCIYGIGSREDYEALIVPLRAGMEMGRDQLLSRLVSLQYSRNDVAFERGQFRVRGDTVELRPAGTEDAVRVEFFGDQIERITRFDPLTGNPFEVVEGIVFYPAKQFVTTENKTKPALLTTREEIADLIAWLAASGTPP